VENQNSKVVEKSTNCGRKPENMLL